MKKVSLAILFSLNFNIPVLADMTTSEAVDLFSNNKFYPTVVKAVDELKIINMYPDHTFRGEKLVDKKDLAKVTLKLIKFIETEKNISLKRLNEISEIPSYIKDKDFISLYNELNQDYSINFLSYEKKINPQDTITMKDFIILTNMIISLNETTNKNPYENKDFNINNTNESLDNLLKYDIIKDMNLKTNKELNRYELSELLIKIANYIRSTR